jgi:ribose transport system substrate-binding protein
MRFVLLLALGLLLLSACGPKGAGAPSSEKRLKLAVIPMGTTHEFWKAIHAGAATAARDLDVDIVWKGPLKEDDRNEQIQIVETLTNAGVDALVLTPMDDKALVRPVAEAAHLGIPTVIYNTPLAGDQYIAYVGTDNYQGGILAARLMGKLLGGKGTAILLRVSEGVIGTWNREEGFLATLKAEFPEIRILSDNRYAGVTTETAYQTVENLLARFGDVDAMFSANESSTFGCLRALQDHGLAGKVIHIGFDSSAKLIEALEKGEIKGLVLQDPFRMGYDGVRTAVARLRGEPYEKNINTGVFLATPENMKDPRISALLAPDLSIVD